MIVQIPVERVSAWRIETDPDTLKPRHRRDPAKVEP
jgi:hypothetical protein